MRSSRSSYGSERIVCDKPRGNILDCIRTYGIAPLIFSQRIFQAPEGHGEYLGIRSLDTKGDNTLSEVIIEFERKITTWEEFMPKYRLSEDLTKVITDGLLLGCQSHIYRCGHRKISSLWVSFRLASLFIWVSERRSNNRGSLSGSSGGG